jgi:F0F1-type ATP synthase assembly protein I
MNQMESKPKRKRTLNWVIIAVIGQVGCVTSALLLAAVGGGLALDNHFQTKPWITIVLLALSIPVSLFLMFFIVRTSVAKMNLESEKPKASKQEESVGK